MWLGLALLGAWPAVGQEGVRLLESGSVRVVYREGQRAMAQRALRVALDPPPFPGIPAADLPLEGTIVLAPTPAAYDSVTGGAPAWSAGVAIPGERLIVLPSFVSSRTPQGDPIVALRHEMAHLAVHRALPGSVPRWFSEGYATWASGEWDENSGWQIRMAFLTGAAPPLDSLTLDWPGNEAEARLAYLLSASAVRHLATRSGDPAFAALLQAWRREGTLDAALRHTYGMTLGQFETEWRKMVRRRYGWLLAAAQIGSTWAAFTVIVLSLGVLRRKRHRERLAAMRVEEARESALREEEDEWWMREIEEEGGVEEQTPRGVDEQTRAE